MVTLICFVPVGICYATAREYCDELTWGNVRARQDAGRTACVLLEVGTVDAVIGNSSAPPN